MENLTPMMQQYMKTKKEYKDCILFYRLGDFYEMFFDDAIVASKALEITLTGKACGLEERAPMCGIPYHAVDSYLDKLVSKGYKVAICEQVEDPKLAKGIVKREVTRIVTPGTNTSLQSLEESKNNYIMSVVHLQNKIGISFADVSTGEFFLTEAEENRKLLDEIYKFSPVEVLCNDAFLVCGIDTEELKNRLNAPLFSLEPWYFDENSCIRCLLKHFQAASTDALGISDFDAGIIAAGSLLQYLYETQKIALTHFTKISAYVSSKYMLLDSSTRRNLELCETLREKQKRGSLLWVLDKTKTAMGARCLRSFIEQPLISHEEILKRQGCIKELCSHAVDRDEIREYLNAIYDLERLLSKVSYKSLNPRDMIAFKNSLQMLPHIKAILSGFTSELLSEINASMDSLSDLYALIDSAICEDPPLSSKEGGFIKDGYHDEVDRLRNAKSEGKNWLMALENDDRERTGIKNLKIKFNKVFGYYFEVTNSYKEMVPEDYIRKQTLANAERYTNQQLKELEDLILNAEDKLFALEYQCFTEIRDKMEENLGRVQKTARAVA
ncbi:MAG: DNA mismatch repair protein MutS, partial [Lachnospiraceae bacterium]|nr:DNA mismatch repair protein MutS [Lachnospiraceae bacterium]